MSLFGKGGEVPAEPQKIELGLEADSAGKKVMQEYTEEELNQLGSDHSTGKQEKLTNERESLDGKLKDLGFDIKDFIDGVIALDYEVDSSVEGTSVRLHGSVRGHKIETVDPIKGFDNKDPHGQISVDGIKASRADSANFIRKYRPAVDLWQSYLELDKTITEVINKETEVYNSWKEVERRKEEAAAHELLKELM